MSVYEKKKLNLREASILNFKLIWGWNSSNAYDDTIIRKKNIEKIFSAKLWLSKIDLAVKERSLLRCRNTYSNLVSIVRRVTTFGINFNVVGRFQKPGNWVKFELSPGKINGVGLWMTTYKRKTKRISLHRNVMMIFFCQYFLT